MKIAIYHNLKDGGALVQMRIWIKYLKRDGHIIKIFKSRVKINSKNIFSNLIETIFYSLKNDYQISKTINNKHFDKIIIFPCYLVQSPFILSFLKKNKNVFYVFAERKREFYEETSFYKKSIKKQLAKLIRLPLKIIDLINCKNASNIIANSYYSKYILNKTYNKISKVIYPCLSQKNKFYNCSVKMNKFALTVGPLIKTKGYDFSIMQLSGTGIPYVSIGRNSDESEKKYLSKLLIKNNIPFRVLSNVDNRNKSKIIRKSKLYLANQKNEPFGISTVEACENNKPIFGLNSGGTAEIVQTGINGVLYPENMRLAKKILEKYVDKYEFKSIIKADWKQSSNKLLKYMYQSHD